MQTNYIRSLFRLPDRKSRARTRAEFGLADGAAQAGEVRAGAAVRECGAVSMWSAAAVTNAPHSGCAASAGPVPGAAAASTCTNGGSTSRSGRFGANVPAATAAAAGSNPARGGWCAATMPPAAAAAGFCHGRHAGRLEEARAAETGLACGQNEIGAALNKNPDSELGATKHRKLLQQSSHNGKRSVKIISIPEIHSQKEPGSSQGAQAAGVAPAATGLWAGGAGCGWGVEGVPPVPPPRCCGHITLYGSPCRWTTPESQM